MNTDMVMVMFELKCSQPKWSLESAQIFFRMMQIAQRVENLKFSLKATKLTRGRFGTHFIECMWANPNTTVGPCCCTCNSIRHYIHEFTQLFKIIEPSECGEETYNKLMEKITNTTL